MYNFVATADQLYCFTIVYTRKGLGKVIIQIVVMSLDFSKMAWKMVYSIGDHVLFLGSGGTKACCSADETGLDRSCVYFTIPNDQNLYKFDIGSTSNSVIIPCVELLNPWKVSDFIMMPNERKTKRTSKRKREESMEAKDECKKILTEAVDFEKACAWSILNGDMVESIVSSLHRLDYIHLRSVSKAHRALLPTVKFTSCSTTTSTYLSPWLMFRRDHNCSTFSFINPMHNNESYLINLSHLMRAVVRFQKGGWLLVSKENNAFCLFFFNPLTRETIKLPELPVNFTFSSISFSSLPISADCIVLAIEQRGYFQVNLYFIRKGEAFWSSRRFGHIDNVIYTPSHNTPVFYNGVLYCVDYNGTLGVFNIEDDSWKVLKKPHKTFDAIYPSFLVECDGEILLVKLGHLGTLFGIFRLDFSRMDWVKVENMGKHMLFVSYTSCVSAIAPNSHMENKVYFPRLCMNGEGVLFYCLATGSYRSFGSQHSASDFTDTEGWYSNCTWIEPNWSKSTAQELDWVKPPS